MSSDRFELINRYLDLGEKSFSDPLARIRDMSESIRNNSKRIYQSSSNISIDESMIAFKGRHQLKQYMPMKPTKHGFKCFLLCESATGYCLDHKFYTGPDQEEFKPRNICLELLRSFENKSFFVYTDNYYTSLPLLNDLTSKGIFLTGTTRKTSITKNRSGLGKKQWLSSKVFEKRADDILFV